MMVPTRQSPNICSTCRARKVRCDGRRDTCGSCERLGFSCSYDIAPGRAPRSVVGRRRAHSACFACHSRKIRCNEGRPSCQRCSRLRLTCTYPTGTAAPEAEGNAASEGKDGDDIATAQPLPKESLSTTSRDIPSVGRSSLAICSPTDVLATRALRVFFHRVHRIPVFAFLHQACIMEQYRNGVLDTSLLMALIGLVSVLEDLGEGTRELGTTYVDQAAAMVVEHMEQPTVSRIQALIFIIKYRALTRRFSSVFMLSAIAIRFAMGLRLNYEDAQLSFLARESCRRTMWSLYLIDSTLAAGYQDFALSGAEMIHIRLPCQDANFEMDTPPEEKKPDGDSVNSSTGPLSLIIQLAQMRHRILHFTKKAVGTYMSIKDIVDSIKALREELDIFRNQLPASFMLSRHNILLQAYSSTLSSFIAIHATWHGCQGILHRLVLHGLVEALSEEQIASLDPDFRKSCEVRCFESAESVTDMLQVVLSLSPDGIALDLEIAVSIYQDLRILIRSQREVDGTVNSTIGDVATSCRTGLKFLRTMFPDAPAVNAIIEDTETLIQDELATPSAMEALGNDSSLHESDPKRDTARPHHILSKHSLVGQIDIPSKGESFLFSPSSAGDQARGATADDGTTGATPKHTVRDTDNEPRDPTSPGFLDISNQLHEGQWSHEHIDSSLYELSELGLPEFDLDSSIFLPGAWMAGAPPDM